MIQRSRRDRRFKGPFLDAVFARPTASRLIAERPFGLGPSEKFTQAHLGSFCGGRNVDEVCAFPNLLRLNDFQSLNTEENAQARYYRRR